MSLRAVSAPRVLILSWEYPPIVEGGLARHVRKLSEQLVRDGVEVHVLTLPVSVPVLPGSGPQLTRPARIDVEGRSYTGAPSYEPGRPHWFPGGYYGGRHVPGGWYDVPFWPSALVLVPTRELAQQVNDALAPLAQSLDLKVSTVYGGTSEIQREIVAKTYGL